MPSRIALITVEIDGNVTGLNRALESVNKTIKTTQSELKDIERLLKLDPSNTELLSQKQEKLKTSIQATKEKLATAIDGCDGCAEQMALTMQDNLNGQIRSVPDTGFDDAPLLVAEMGNFLVGIHEISFLSEGIVRIQIIRK